MPAVLLLLPGAFLLISYYGFGVGMEELRENQWLPPRAKELVWGFRQFQFYVGMPDLTFLDAERNLFYSVGRNLFIQ